MPIDEQAEVIRKGSFAYASQYLNPDETIIEEIYMDTDFYEVPANILQSSAFIGSSSPSTNINTYNGERNGIINYVIQPGDVVSQIANAFGISTNTLLWANDLSAWDYIKPGQELVILPVSGLKYTIKKGDSLEKVVSTYKGDLEKTIEFNGLPADGKVAVGVEIIIPDGRKPVYYAPTVSYATYSSFPRPYATQSHTFPWGQCTWYVAQRRYVPWSGHAKTWIYKAPQYGFATGGEPRAGAIVQTRENSYYGHVAYVESVNGNYITISEMSLGYGIRKVRTLHKDDWRIIGYIY
ncbi:MAG: CHAP domain-containing protein [Patescibacteria group bacterium]